MPGDRRRRELLVRQPGEAAGDGVLDHADEMGDDIAHGPPRAGGHRRRHVGTGGTDERRQPRSARRVQGAEVDFGARIAPVDQAGTLAKNCFNASAMRMRSGAPDSTMSTIVNDVWV